MSLLHRIPLVAVAIALVAACNNDGGTAPEPALRASVADPAGDTYASSASDGLVVPDIVRFEAERRSADLVITLAFTHPVADPATGASNLVAGYIDIDADQDAATGITPATDVFRPDASGGTGMGADYIVQLWGSASGGFDVWDVAGDSVVATVGPVFEGSQLTLRVPLSALGHDEGHVYLATVVGTAAEPTDIAPNDGHLALGGPPASRANAAVVTAASALPRAARHMRGWRP